jgi:putative hemolysin
VAGLLSLSGLEELNRAYACIGSHPNGHGNLFEDALAQLRVRLEVSEGELARVPETGATLVVANHPFGGIDGLALAAALLRRRKDVRIVTNTLLSRITKLAPWFLDVAVFDAHQRTASNATQVRAALRHLTLGGMLAVFPAGTVSRFRPNHGAVVDSEWSASVGMLARRSGATVVPCYFPGSNSVLFQAAGVLHENLSTALLVRELLARRDSRIHLQIGQPVRANTIRRFEDDAMLTAWLRLRTYDLRKTDHQRHSRTRAVQPVVPPVDPAEVRMELSDPSRRQCLIEQGPYRVYLAQQADIPRTLDEIARLREVTFRSVGEGTGCAQDMDVFDSTYHHLVLYDEEIGCVVGAYRLALCDDVIREQGFEGLYTNSLFRFRPSMRKELMHAIELGRSFVRPEYQKKPLALALLWRGIGEVLRKYPRYHRLLGAVSISERYRGSARNLLVSFLHEVHSDVRLSRLVDPRNPLRIRLDAIERRVLRYGCRNLRELSKAIVDASGLRVPVLLERYLELGARVLALNVDSKFGNCIDALIFVDLDQAPENLLRRFMSDEGYSAYRDYSVLARRRINTV